MQFSTFTTLTTLLAGLATAAPATVARGASGSETLTATIEIQAAAVEQAWTFTNLPCGESKPLSAYVSYCNTPLTQQELELNINIFTVLTSGVSCTLTTAFTSATGGYNQAAALGPPGVVTEITCSASN